MPATCVADGCERWSVIRKMCRMHYQRWKNTDGADVKRCSIDGCDGPVAGRGLCNKHYLRWKNNGDPMVVQRSLEPMPCSFEGCGKRAKSKGLCPAHYKRLRIHGDPSVSLATSYGGIPCAVDGCNEQSKARGWCKSHYDRWRRYGDPLNPGNKPHIGQKCLVEGCRNKNRSKGYCNKHSQRIAKHGSPDIDTPPGGVTKNRKCSVPGCGRKHGAYGYCWKHYYQTERGRAVYRAYSFRRRMRETEAPGHATSDQFRARWDYYGGKCWMCGNEAHHVDHVKPLSRGGSNWPANLRPACSDCNLKKHARWPFKPEDILASNVA